MTPVTEELLLERIKDGRLIEDSSHATERYIEGLETERELMEPLFESEDAKEGLSAFMEKRKPEFSR